MPEQPPNQKMESLLRSYAEVRRQQAGPPFELAVTAREALQGQVSRTVVRATPRVGPPPSFWAVWMPRFAAVGVLLVIFGLMAMMAIEPVKLQVMLRTAKLRDAIAQKFNRPESSAGKAAAKAPPVSTVAALAVAPAPAPAKPTGPAEKTNPATDAVATSEPSAASAVAETPTPPVAAPSAPPPFISAADGAASVHLQFVQTARPSRYRENLNAPPLPKVLVTFSIERFGQKVRVTDADGSVYEGPVLNLSIAAASEPQAGGLAPLPEKAIKEDAGNFGFKVSGQNRQSNEEVLFSGNFFGESKDSPDAQKIMGKVQIGSGSEFEIEARPSSP